jgi:Flp pilus assembly protein TadB
MSAENGRLTRRLKLAGLLSGSGLVVQLVAAFHWTPLTFIVSAVVGAPLIIAGGLVFAAAVWSNMKDKGAV